ncbi:hypothetical protein H8D85_02215 [bacterium]|nr:hypothetical protein [bacterium]
MDTQQIDSNIVFEGTVDKVSTMADGTLRVYVGTQEMPIDKMAKLFSFDKSAGYFLFSKHGISKEEIKAVEDTSKGVAPKNGKSPSQRLRNVLYHVWDKGLVNGTECGFEDFYLKEMNKITEHYINKLD